MGPRVLGQQHKVRTLCFQRTEKPLPSPGVMALPLRWPGEVAPSFALDMRGGAVSKGCLPFGCLPLPVLQCPHLLQSSPLPLGWGSRCLPLMKGTQPSATLAFICMESFPLCSLNIRMSQQVLGASLLGALEGPQSLGSLRAPLGTRTAGQVGDLPAFWPLGRPAWLALGGSRGSAASQARVGVAQASLQAAFTDDSALVPEARAGSSVSLQPQGWSCMC